MPVIHSISPKVIIELSKFMPDTPYRFIFNDIPFSKQIIFDTRFNYHMDIVKEYNLKAEVAACKDDFSGGKFFFCTQKDALVITGESTALGKTDHELVKKLSERQLSLHFPGKPILTLPLEEYYCDYDHGY